uniref:Putative RNA-directed DNA polymerase n=1 Tax=Sipha flava TaxID=143950 RepID=A0A2S2R150_9HEMI
MAMLHLSYFPPTWEYSIIIMISKPNKPKHLISFYRLINLLPTFVKLFKKLILYRISLIINQHSISPKSQLDFRRKHNTIHQIHRITYKISDSFETKPFCPGIFLDISQAFDRVWYDGLLFKLKYFPHSPYYLIIKSYLENWSFSIRQKNSYSTIHNIKARLVRSSG